MKEVKPHEAGLGFVKDGIKEDTFRAVIRIVFGIISVFLISFLITKREIVFDSSEAPIYFLLCVGVITMSVLDLASNIFRILENNFILRGLEQIEKND